jgi:hypothetical protein
MNPLLPMKRYSVLLLLASLALQASAQRHRWAAPLEPVSRAGYYRISLPPSVTGKLKEDLSDIRLYRGTHEEPYLHEQESPFTRSLLFREYRIVSRRSTPGCCTELVLENSSKAKISNILLQVKNAEVTKTGKLSGSEDGKTWYVVRESYPLAGISNPTETVDTKPLEFPVTDYRYLKLEIADSLSGPLNILKAGYYDTQKSEGLYQPCLPAAITQKDTAGASLVKVIFPEPQLVDRLELTIRGPRHYSRNVSLFMERQLTHRRRRTTTYREVQESFTVSSSHRNQFTFPRHRLKEFYLEVENMDNAPLHVQEVKAFQLPDFLIAYLEPGATYELKFGDSTLAAPRYDIALFRDSILSAKIPLINPVSLRSLDAQPVSAPASKRRIPREVIWAALGLVIVLLGFMSVRMIKDMSRKDS